MGIVFKTISPDFSTRLNILMQNSYCEINIEMLKIIIPKDNEQENFNKKNYLILKTLV